MTGKKKDKVGGKPYIIKDGEIYVFLFSLPNIPTTKTVPTFKSQNAIKTYSPFSAQFSL